MKRQDEFRIFYNHTIHPELMRMELKRKRVLRLMLISSVLLVGLIVIELYLNILAITLIGGVIIAFYISWLVYQAQRFRQTFKPSIVSLLLDFLDDSLNYSDFSYNEKKYFPKSLFVASKMFDGVPYFYKGEDYIKGRIGSVQFELCEVLVQNLSPVNKKVFPVFKGIFLHSHLSSDQKGNVLVIPRHRKQFHGRSIRNFIEAGGSQVEIIYDALFKNTFVVYASPFTNIRDFLSDDLQKLIANYYANTKRDIFISFVDNQLFLFLDEPDEFLEPYLFRSNVSFKLIDNFFRDIQLVMTIVEDFDRIY